MFERFRATFAVRRNQPAAAGTPWADPALMRIEGYGEFSAEFAGASFLGGLYRVHDERSGQIATALIAEAFPEFAARVFPFGFDWLGRQFAVDIARVVEGSPQVLLLEPCSGEVLEIPASFVEFHDEVLVTNSEAALALSAFRDWAAANPLSIPLARDQCVGYIVPLFLGGQDGPENFEVTDFEVYWSICAQLRAAVAGLAEGTVITEVTIE